MIILIHGDNTIQSRSELNRLKKPYPEIRELNGRNLDSATLTQALQSGSVFEADTAVVIERLLSRLKGRGKPKDPLLTVIADSASQIPLILWEDREITRSVIAGLPFALTEKIFKIPAVIFQFLDGIAPDKSKIMLELYQRTLVTDPPELIHSMLLRRLRQLIMVRDGIIPPGMAGWQSARLTSQAKLFTIKQLKNIYRKLIDIEFRVKTGDSPLTLGEMTELLLCEI